MNIQKLILSAIRALPGSLVGKMAGPPLEIDGYRLDPHMHLASKSADLGTGDGDLEALRTGVAAGLALTNGPPRRSVKWHDTEFAGPGGALTMRVYKPARQMTNSRQFCFSIRAVWLFLISTPATHFARNWLKFAARKLSRWITVCAPNMRFRHRLMMPWPCGTMFSKMLEA